MKPTIKAACLGVGWRFSSLGTYIQNKLKIKAAKDPEWHYKPVLLQMHSENTP